MAFNMKEVASLRGDEKKFAENFSKIDWSGASQEKESDDDRIDRIMQKHFKEKNDSEFITLTRDDFNFLKSKQHIDRVKFYFYEDKFINETRFCGKEVRVLDEN